MAKKQNKTKKVYLSALNMELLVPECISYEDKGFVKSTKSYANFLEWQGTWNPNSFFQTEEEGQLQVGGLRGLRNFEGGYNFIAFYSHDANPVVELATRAHEETHFIHIVNCLDQLGDRMRRSQGIDIDFRRVRKKMNSFKEKKEVIAELGALFAVHQSYGLNAVREYPSEFYEYMSSAQTIYLRSIENFKNSQKKNGLRDLIRNYWRKNG